MADNIALATPLPISVLHDATFFIPAARGPICAGNEHGPFGNACPRRGDVASADCRSELGSFNGARCVAPADAQCLKVARATWACVFPAQQRFSRVEADAGGALVSTDSTRAMRALRHRGDRDDQEDKHKVKESSTPPVVVTVTPLVAVPTQE